MSTNRRTFLAAAATAALATTTAASATTRSASAATPVTASAAAGDGGPDPRHLTVPLTARQALARLIEGNRRYAAVHSRHPHEDLARRHSLVGGQHPFATVLGCVDSRVPPELIFDQGLGDLFCMRTAGHVLDEAVLGSIQYGIAELHIPLVLVLGHEGCGAVAATLDHVRTGEPAPGHLARLIDSISLAAEATREGPGDWADRAVRTNSLRVRDALRRDHELSGTTVLAARFDLDSGRVGLLP
ncbi:carbonic anhydrase [Streptomyces sp. NPDC002851]